MGSSRTRKHNNIACQLKVVAGQGGLAVLSYVGTVFVPLYACPGRLTIRSLYAFILYSIIPFRPRKKKAVRYCRFESKFICYNSAFYWHIMLSNWSVTDHMTDTSHLVQKYLVPLYTHFLITFFIILYH